MLIKNTPIEYGISLQDSFIQSYMVLWIMLVVVALGYGVSQRQKIVNRYQGYFQFILMRWKVYAFVLSGLFVSFGGYFTDDETWDFISGFGMSILTYLFAPLCVGIVYRFIKGQERTIPVFIAVILSFFAFSWFYDGYLVLRDGVYTQRWLGNLILSSVIYFCAGIFWNLELNENKKISLGFLRANWPQPPLNKKLGWAGFAGLGVGAVAGHFLVSFVGWHVDLQKDVDVYQFIFSVCGGFLLPFILAEMIWSRLDLNKFPWKTAGLFILPSIAGCSVSPMFFGLLHAGVAQQGDNPGAIGGTILAGVVLIPLYWFSLFVLYRIKKLQKSTL